jgi:type II secretory ATPase GspE/PulE/Tfp pilus assembly ATPase PilB-like protein
VKASKEIIEQLKEIDSIANTTEVFEGKGCQYCRFTGYYGRTAIYEILVVSEAIRELILNKSSSQQIKQKAVSEGMRILRQDGLIKVAKGLTTFSEVIRVTQQEELPED